MDTTTRQDQPATTTGDAARGRPPRTPRHRISTTISEEQYAQLERLAQQRGETLAEVVRQSVACLLSDQAELARRKAAVQSLLAKGPPYDWAMIHDLMAFPAWQAEREEAVKAISELSLPTGEWEEIEEQLGRAYLQRLEDVPV